MAQRSATTQRPPFLPVGATSFLRRRLVELIGLGIFAMALALAVALASYAPNDPSWNVATGAGPDNLLGKPGAHAADLLLQTLGLGAWVLVLALAGWAWGIASHRGLRHIWLNLSALPFALVATAMLAAAVPTPAAWPLSTGMGGWIGRILDDGAMELVHRWWANEGPIAYVAVLSLASLSLVVVALGLGSREWQGLGRAGSWLLHSLWQAARWTATPLERGSEAGATPVGRRSRSARREPRLFGQPETEVETSTPERPAPRIAKGPGRLRASRRAAAEQQPMLDLGPTNEPQLPPLALLGEAPARDRVETVSEDALEQNARLLEAVLADFGVRGTIGQIRPGPVITRYELEPARGTKTARVIGLSDDIARSMSAVSVRAAVVAGRNAIGIELPNTRRETVPLRELLASTEYDNTTGQLALALGKDVAGSPVIADLARMPHLLIAGTTGSGKSVAVNTMILSLLYRLSPQRCRFIMIDPKMLELSAYDGIPHLLAPVVTDPGKAVVALKWTVREMENRYQALSKLGVRNIASYNQRLAQAAARGEELKRTVQTGFDAETGEPIFEDQPLDLTPLPAIVVVVDEMADLMLLAGKEIEGAVQRLSQMARAAGIHLIMATQRPSVDVITGTIKANFPTRISFQVTSKVDSRTILGEQGAEQLLGSGDMLYMANGGRITRVHGPLVRETEVDSVVAFLKAQGTPEYLEAITEEPDDDGGLLGNESPADALYDQAVALVCRERKASTSFIQRHLQIGYNRAARIMERMEAASVVSPANHVGKREVLARDIDA